MSFYCRQKLLRITTFDLIAIFEIKIYCGKCNLRAKNCIEYSQNEYKRCCECIQLYVHSVALLKILYLMNRWEELEKLVGWQSVLICCPSFLALKFSFRTCPHWFAVSTGFYQSWMCYPRVEWVILVELTHHGWRGLESWSVHNSGQLCHRD